MDIFDRAGDEGEVSIMKGIADDSLQRSLYLPYVDNLHASSERSARMQNSVESFRMIPPSVLQPHDASETNTETRFIESEADLDSSLKLLLPLTQNPPLFYPELVKSGTIALLAGLLSHENTDIAIDVVEVIQELTDEDVGAEVDDLEEDEVASATRIAMGGLIDELVSRCRARLIPAQQFTVRIARLQSWSTKRSGRDGQARRLSHPWHIRKHSLIHASPCRTNRI
jgi:hypothetical protein